MVKITSMSSGAIDPIAVTKRVFWTPVTTTTILKVGQPVCYNSDTVLDHKGRASDPTHIGLTDHTYAEGAQDKIGRMFVVEEPLTANLHAFAGICKSLGPKAGAIGDMIEIFVPNGAMLPCWIDQSVTLESTVLGIRDGEADLSYPTRPIGIAQETIDRSDPNGLCWVKVDPSRFLWQDNEGAALAMGPSGTSLHLVKANYAHVSGYRTALMIQQTNSGALAAAGGGSAITGYILQSGAITGTTVWLRAILGQLNITGTINADGAQLFGMIAQVGGVATMTKCEHVAGLMVDAGLTNAPTTGDYEILKLQSSSAADLDSVIFMYGPPGGQADYLFKLMNLGGGAEGFPIRDGGTGDTTLDTGGDWKKIRIYIEDAAYWLVAMTDPSET